MKYKDKAHLLSSQEPLVVGEIGPQGIQCQRDIVTLPNCLDWGQRKVKNI